MNATFIFDLFICSIFPPNFNCRQKAGNLYHTTKIEIHFFRKHLKNEPRLETYEEKSTINKQYSICATQNTLITSARSCKDFKPFYLNVPNVCNMIKLLTFFLFHDIWLTFAWRGKSVFQMTLFEVNSKKETWKIIAVNKKCLKSDQLVFDRFLPLEIFEKVRFPIFNFLINRSFIIPIFCKKTHFLRKRLLKFLTKER